MILNHLPALVIQEDAGLRLLRVCWNRGKNIPAFRDAVTRLVDLAQQQGTRHLLLELNDLPDVPVYDQLWLSTTLLPRAAKLPVRRLVIILAGQRIYNRHVLESLLTQFQAQIGCDIQFFAQSEPALDWLTDNSPQMPALLAEWEHERQPGTGTAAAHSA